MRFGFIKHDTFRLCFSSINYKNSISYQRAAVLKWSRLSWDSVLPLPITKSSTD